MFKTLKETFTKDKNLPERAFRLEMLWRVLDGTIYDNLPHPFHLERNSAGEYIPLRDRRPCVRYRLCKLVVDDSVSLLFSEGHFPEIEAASEETAQALARIVKECRINERMIDAATRGAVGSVALLLRVLDSRVYVDVMPTPYLTPVWKRSAPDELEKVVEEYKVRGQALKAAGYDVGGDDAQAWFWFRREWDETAETWFVPRKDINAVPVKDKSRSVAHGLGFVPMVWIKNLPGGDEIDGKPTVPDEAVDTQIEIDYQLSQAGRGLKYSSDPTLLLKEPAVGQNGQIIKGGGNAIVVNSNGDAKMLEINGTAAEAVMAYVRMLRELAIESMHGNRSNADKLSAAQSGRALELMNQSLVWLADRLRISYGEGALIALLTMIVKASDKIALKYKDGSKVDRLNGDGIALRWPSWYPPTEQDRQNTATTLKTLTDGALMSTETAVKSIAADYDIEDVKKELKAIKADRTERDAGADKQIKIAE